MQEFKGDDIIYLIEVEDDDETKMRRPFNQTDGSKSIESDSIELETKDRTGSDYGTITESVEMEGILTKDDPAIKHVKKYLRKKKLVKITEVNLQTKEAEEGKYMISSFEQESSVGEFATYSLEAELNGEISETELDDIPDGAEEEEEEESDGAEEEEEEESDGGSDE